MKETYLAGAVAAFTVDVLVYPLDTLKTRLQSRDFVKRNLSTSKPKQPVLRGLYQGIGSVILATLPAAGLFFSTYETAKVVFSRTEIFSLPEPIMHSCASGMAEMASCLVLAPAEVIKQNAQMVRGGAESKGATASTSLLAFRRLMRSGTASRLFSGYTALIARNIPFTALQFPVFEYTRARLWKRRARLRGDDVPRSLPETGLVAGASAALAGACAAFITTPSDVIKTRMMVQLDTGDGKGAGEKKREGVGKKSPLEVTRTVYVERGVRGFFRGALLRSAATAIASGLYLGTYDTAKLFLERGQ